jgi:hypothetical protein
MTRLKYRDIQGAVTRQDYKFFDYGDFNLNLVGIRASGGATDTFNDTLCVLFRQDDQPMLITMACTTDPGKHYLENPLTKPGTAILKPGQYRGMWRLGQHRGQYPALVQRGVCAVYRDNTRDPDIECNETTVQNGLFGINCHRAHETSKMTRINRWSAGCQVVQESGYFELLLSLCQLSATRWGDKFTYTLINQADL